MEKNYLDIMIQSLQKKVKILDGISEKNKEQGRLLGQEELDMDAFEKNVLEKSELIDQIALLDDGFEDVYGRIKYALEKEKQEHKEEILQMKQLITEITEKSMTIQSEEARNRRLLEMKFSQERKRVRNLRSTSEVTKQYYDNMTKLRYVDAQFMDKKK